MSISPIAEYSTHMIYYSLAKHYPFYIIVGSVLYLTLEEVLATTIVLFINK